MLTKNQTDKAIPAKGNNETSKLLKLLASESNQEEKELSLPGDLKYEEGLREYLKRNPNKTEEDYQIEVIGIDLAKGLNLSRKNLIQMLEGEYPAVFRLYKNNLNNLPTIEIKKLLDNLDKQSVPFSNGGFVKWVNIISHM